MLLKNNIVTIKLILISVFFFNTNQITYADNSFKITFKDFSKKTQSFNVYTLNPIEGNKKKVIHILHGYTESCHYMKPYISFFTNEGFEIKCLELPGHGNSTGKKYDIDHFDTYLIQIENYIKQLSTNQENYFIAHSTGAVGITMYLKKYKTSPFEKIFLVAPLTRPIFYSTIRFTTNVLNIFVNRVRRIESIRSSEYQDAKATDPKLYNYIPLSWTRQCSDFVQRQTASQFPVIENVVSIFGTKDGVIDYEDGVQKYNTWFPNSQVYQIEDGSHHLHFGNKTITNQLFRIINQNI